MNDVSQSRYTLSRTAFFLACIVAIGAFALPDTAKADTLTCESHNNQQHQCRINTRGGVTLQTQLSKSPCRLHSTWGYNDRFVWVSNGCRAVFHVGSDTYRRNDHHDSDEATAAVAGIALLALGAAAAHEAHEDHKDRNYDDRYDYDYNRNDYNRHHQRHYVDHVTCSSENGRYNYCRASVNDGHVRILRQLSKAACRHNEDWGYNRRGIWVENGCRATFEIEN